MKQSTTSFRFMVVALVMGALLIIQRACQPVEPEPTLGKLEVSKTYQPKYTGPIKEIDTSLIVHEDNDDSLRVLYDRNNYDFRQGNEDPDKDDFWHDYYN